ncbi:MAG: hypothetical protein FWE20_03050 [Defluviitaleaceae bacterium]|nr:hypothetical protein [Defluviitaleaceae bacterium]
MRTSIGGVNVGGSSILVIFVLLCLTTFATLAMVSATASLRLAQRVIAASDVYYAADSRAEELLAEISYIVRNAPEDEIAPMLLEAGAHLGYDNIIRYAVPIDDVLLIEVQLEMTERQLNIISWAMRADYDPDLYGTGGLNVWPGR